MATYHRAAQAKELIFDVARLNNAALANIEALSTIWNNLLALTPAQQNEVIAAVEGMGYSAAEIQAILTNWSTVAAAVQSAGIAPVAMPR